MLVRRRRISLLSILILFQFIWIACDSSEDIDLCNGTLTLEVLEVLDAVEGSSIGSITVKATGGTPPYQYSPDGVNFSSTNNFSNLGPGLYTIFVIDNNECKSEERVTVPEQMIVSFSNQIVPILSANCNISGCHCDGNSLCFETYETVKANVLGIKDRTAARAMPPSYSGKTLTDNQIQDISNWVYQGAENN